MPAVPQRAQKIVDAARSNVPEGTFAIAAGLAIAGVTAYGFQIIARAELTDTGYAALNGLWFIVFIVTPGFFQPIEQEVARALAHRRAQGQGGGPLVKRAGVLGGLLALAVIALSVIFSPVLVNEVFHEQNLMLAALITAVVSYFLTHITRGTLSGNRRFGPYGMMHGTEGIVRIAACFALVAVGSESAGLYGFALALPPFFAILLGLRGQKGLMAPGPEAPYSELSGALVLLLAGSLFAQTLSYAAPLGAIILESGGNKDQLAGFISGVFIARIPILIIQAVQAALLPKLSGLAGAGRHADFKSGVRRLTILVAALGAIGTVAGFALGPWAGNLLFGDKWTLGHRDVALLAAGSGAFIVALTLAQGVIALRGYALALYAWVAGLVTFVAVCTVGGDIYLRVENASVAGAVVSAVLMLVFLNSRIKLATDGDLAEFVELVEHEPLEI